MAEVRVKSEMSGVVCKVLVEAGTTVAEFDPLVLVESMKMEIPITAPRAGTVSAVEVAEGDLIAEGEVAVILSS